MAIEHSNHLLQSMSLGSMDELRARSEAIERYALKHGASAFSLSLSAEAGFELSVRERAVDDILYRQDQSIHMNVYRGLSCGHVSVSSLDLGDLEHACDRALSIAQLLDDDPCQGLPDPESLAHHFPDLCLYHPWHISVDDAKKMALDLEAMAREDDRIAMTDSCEISSLSQVHMLMNSHGFFGCYPSSYHEMSLGLLARDENSLHSGLEYTMAVNPKLLAQPSYLAQRAKELCLSRLNAQSLPTQQVPVIFDAPVAAGLIRHFLTAISGSRLYQKQSFLLDKMGEMVFSPIISIEQRPHLLEGVGSLPFDAEGVQTHQRTLVASGELQSYLLGTYSARRLGLESTGNASGAQNVRVIPGDLSQAALIKAMDRGLLVTDVMGQGVNLQNGNYSRGAYGFWVEHGEIQYPVHEITIASNLKDMFQQVIAIGSDLDTRGSVQAPSMLIEKMTVAG